MAKIERVRVRGIELGPAKTTYSFPARGTAAALLTPCAL